MEKAISVLPVEGGWLVQADDGEPVLFFSGGRAEAYARRLAQAWGATGACASVVVHDRGGERVGAWRVGPATDGACRWTRADGE